eukprot:UN26964
MHAYHPYQQRVQKTPYMVDNLPKVREPHTHPDGELLPEKEPIPNEELPINDSSKHASYLKNIQLGHQMMSLKDYKTLVQCLLLKIPKYTHNAPHLLNVQLNLTFQRVLMKKKFLKLDCIFHLCATPPKPNECLTLPQLNDQNWTDIVSHYSQYVLVSNPNEAPMYARGKVFGSEYKSKTDE